MITDNSRSNQMNLAMEIYDIFRDDENKAKRLAGIFEYIEQRFLSRDEAVKSSELDTAKLELTLEIEKTRKDLTIEIGKTRNEFTIEIGKVRNDLTIEIGKVRNEIEKIKGELSVKIEQIRSDLMKYINRHTIWVISAISIIIGALKALDYILK